MSGKFTYIRLADLLDTPDVFVDGQTLVFDGNSGKFIAGVAGGGAATAYMYYNEVSATYESKDGIDPATCTLRVWIGPDVPKNIPGPFQNSWEVDDWMINTAAP